MSMATKGMFGVGLCAAGLQPDERHEAAGLDAFAVAHARLDLDLHEPSTLPSR